MPAKTLPRLILASGSRYRRELLARLRIPFASVAPDIDESALAGEAPPALALRLACAKAQAVRGVHPDALIIGSDQVAVIDEVRLDKPGDHRNAVSQLRLMRGKRVSFLTALCLCNARTARQQTAVVPVIVQMRSLTDDEIERYLKVEQPYDCAGSARVEGFGITLVDKLEGDDPTALIGLPLVKLADMLRKEGFELP